METNRKQALEQLRDKVKAGAWQHTDWPTVEKAFWGNWNEAALYFQQAYDGSLDAALTLHKAVLPDYDILLSVVDGKPYASVGDAKILRKYTAESTTLARSLLLTDLEALIAQEGE